MTIRATLAAVLALAALAPVASAQGPAADKRGVDPAAPNPLAGEPWYTDQVWGLPARAVQSYAARGDHDRANLMRLIADRPQFRWFGAWIARSRRAR